SPPAGARSLSGLKRTSGRIYEFTTQCRGPGLEMPATMLAVRPTTRLKALIGPWFSRTTKIMRGGKFHYGWVVIGTTCAVLLTGAGVRSTPGILMVPLEEEFHWSRATIALSVSINLILYGCIGPFAAAIMERFGVRRSVLCALVLVAVGVAST